jgi:ketosteroid isomerase-like protein
MTASDAETGWSASTVLFRYCRAIDSHDATALAAVFSEDVALVVGAGDATQTFAGRDLVVSLLASLFEQRRWARHMVSNVLVDVNADGSLAVRSSFQYVLAKDGENAMGLGDYEVTMREIGGELLITVLSAAILDEITVPRPQEQP